MSVVGHVQPEVSTTDLVEVTARLRRLLPSTENVKRAAVAIWMNVLIAAVVVVAAITAGALWSSTSGSGPSWSIRILTLFAVWLLSFLPGWLYVRFLGQRAGALWDEYVLNLYRLGVDDAKYLPPPPVESPYFELNEAATGGAESANIYRQKFNAFYGRQVSSRPEHGENFRVKVETLFPVFLCTVTLAVAWSVVLWDPYTLMSPTQPWASLEYGYLGAYVFATSMLVRRFYQSDLRPSAYASVILRIIVVLLTLVVVHQLFVLTRSTSNLTDGSELVAAFVIGFFPLVGLQALQRLAGKALHVVVPQMAPEYPLDQLDGLNIWYEARLVEEGVEDMQNLTTMNLVDVILHTRAPVGRLVDWIDQAFLLIHLDVVTRAEISDARDPNKKSTVGANTRVALRRTGVRSATDLLKAFGTRDDSGAAHLSVSDDRLRAADLDPGQIELLVRLLDAEPGLAPVWNWKAGGARRHAISA